MRPPEQDGSQPDRRPEQGRHIERGFGRPGARRARGHWGTAIALLLAGILLAPLIAGAAEPPRRSVTVSLGKVDIVLPAPHGYQEISTYSPDTVHALAGLGNPRDRLLAVFLPDEDVARIEAGKAPTLAHYLLAQVHVPTEDIDTSPFEFNRIRLGLDQQVRAELGPRPAGDRSIAPLQPGQTRTEAVHLDTEAAYGFISVSRYRFEPAHYAGRPSAPINRDTEVVDYLIGAASNMLYARRRVFNVYVYKKLDAGNNDLALIARISQAWSRAILEANDTQGSQ